jgi:hypothetical protein
VIGDENSLMGGHSIGLCLRQGRLQTGFRPLSKQKPCQPGQRPGKLALGIFKFISGGRGGCSGISFGKIAKTARSFSKKAARRTKAHGRQFGVFTYGQGKPSGDIVTLLKAQDD